MELRLIMHAAVAIGLGLLVGLQREWSRSHARTGGLRSFALITLFGMLCGEMADRSQSDWVIAAGLLAVVALFWRGRLRAANGNETDRSGITTDIAALVMFTVGIMIAFDHAPLAVVTTGFVAVLLQWKQPLHQIVERMGEDDLRAVVRLVIIGMVILPVMPNESYGPYEVLNPFRIWLIVVLIVGISLAAYVAQRLLGGKVGTILTGVLGGFISSTATTVSYARRTHEAPSETAGAAIVIMLASSIVFARVLFEVAIVAPDHLAQVAPPIAALMGFMLLISVSLFLLTSANVEPSESTSPPSMLAAAVTFGALYAAVLMGVAFVKEHFGDAGVYVVAGLSGLTDMDAITLSSAQLMNAGNLEPPTVWRLIIIGALSNLLFKFCTVAAIASRGLMWRMGLLFTISGAGGVAIIIFWPG